MASQLRVGLYADSTVVGGAERSLLTLASAYRGQASLVVISPSSEVLAAAAEIAPEVETHRIDQISGVIGGFLRHRQALADLDLALLQVTLPNPFAARQAQLAAFSLRIPTIAVQQLVLAPNRRRGALLVRLLAYPLAATVAVGKRSAADLQRLYRLPSSKLHVIHNGIGLPAPGATQFERRPVIGCVARYETQKGLDRLVRAIAEVPRARLVLVGDGSLRSELFRLVDALGVADKVEIQPWRNEARQMIGGFDVFALASRAEAFPLTIVEAMLARTPVIATDVGSVGDAVIDEETGLLVTSGDHNELVHALTRLVDDRLLASRLADAAYERAVSHFTAADMASRYDVLWQSIRSASAPVTDR